MVTGTLRKKHFLVISSIGLALLLLALGIAVYLQASSFTRWIEQDAGSLMPYPTVLYPERPEIPETAEIDAALAGQLAEGRLVVSMSRSEYYRLQLPPGHWVKVHLITSKPGEEQTRIQIKLLAKMVREQGEWQIARVEELAMP